MSLFRDGFVVLNNYFVVMVKIYWVFVVELVGGFNFDGEILLIFFYGGF